MTQSCCHATTSLWRAPLARAAVKSQMRTDAGHSWEHKRLLTLSFCNLTLIKPTLLIFFLFFWLDFSAGTDLPRSYIIVFSCRGKKQVSHLLNQSFFGVFFWFSQDYITHWSGMEHTHCAPIATAAVLLPTTLWQKQPIGFQHLDFFFIRAGSQREEDRQETGKWH